MNDTRCKVRWNPVILFIILVLMPTLAVFFPTQSQYRSTPDERSKVTEPEFMHLVVVSCGRPNHQGVKDYVKPLELSLMMIKSAAMFAHSPLHIHIFKERLMKALFHAEITSWAQNVQNGVKHSIYDVNYSDQLPAELIEEWKTWYKSCGSFRLLLPMIMKDITDAAIYCDSDVIFVKPIDELWHHLRLMNKRQVAGISPTAGHPIEVQKINVNFIPHPSDSFQINPGAILMNFTRILKADWRMYDDVNVIEAPTAKYGVDLLLPYYKKYKGTADHDPKLLNSMFHFNPGVKMGKGRKLASWLVLVSQYCIFTSGLGPPFNLRVVELGRYTAAVSWTASPYNTWPFDALISPIGEGETHAPQFFNNSYAKWTSLVPGKSYDVEVRSIVGGSTSSLPAVIKLTTVPATPFNMRISKFVNPMVNQYRVTDSKTIMYPVYGAVVSWDQPDAVHYNDFSLSIDPAHGTIRVPVKLKNGLPTQDNTEQSRIVWDLLPGVLYKFTVQSKSNGVFSNPLTGKERMPPETPGPITVEDLAPSSVLLSWDGEHRGILDGYAVETDPRGGVTVLVDDDPQHPKRRINNLIPGTKYRIEVFSIVDGLLSFKPSVVELSTPPEVPRNNVSSEEIRAESVFITWNPPPGKLEYYETVYYPTDRDFGRLRQRLWQPRVNLTNLDPGSAYQIEIHAVSNDLVSDPLRAVVYTRPLPPNSVLTTSTHDTIVLIWKTVYFDGGAKIEYFMEDEKGKTTTVFYDPGINEMSITDLEPGSDYIIRVFTVKNGVESDPVLLTIRTKPKPSRDTVPIPPEAAASEKTSNPATASTTTTAKTVPEAAALFAETTEAVENVQAITAASKTNESVTDRRVEDFDPTTATTPSASTPTTKTYHSSAMQNQYSSTTGSSTARSLRTQEEATSSSTAAVATNKTDTTVPPIGATTTRSDTQQTSPITRKSTISQEPTTSTSSAAKLRYTSSYSEPKDPPKTKANTTEYMTTRSTTTQQTAPTTKFDSAITKTTQHRTNAATSTTEASARITLARKRETTFTSPPPFSNEETAEPPKTFREQPTTTTSRQSFVTTSTLDDTNYRMLQDVAKASESREILQSKIYSSVRKWISPQKSKKEIRSGKGRDVGEVNAIEPVGKAGEIYFPNTPYLGSTLAPHFSMPGVSMQRTVKLFPTTKYFPWRTTTNPTMTKKQIPITTVHASPSPTFYTSIYTRLQYSKPTLFPVLTSPSPHTWFSKRLTPTRSTTRQTHPAPIISYTTPVRATYTSSISKKSSPKTTTRYPFNLIPSTSRPQRTSLSTPRSIWMWRTTTHTTPTIRTSTTKSSPSSVSSTKFPDYRRTTSSPLTFPLVTWRTSARSTTTLVSSVAFRNSASPNPSTAILWRTSTEPHKTTTKYATDDGPTITIQASTTELALLPFIPEIRGKVLTTKPKKTTYPTAETALTSVQLASVYEVGITTSLSKKTKLNETTHSTATPSQKPVEGTTIAQIRPVPSYVPEGRGHQVTVRPKKTKYTNTVTSTAQEKFTTDTTTDYYYSTGGFSSSTSSETITSSQYLEKPATDARLLTNKLQTVFNKNMPNMTSTTLRSPVATYTPGELGAETGSAAPNITSPSDFTRVTSRRTVSLSNQRTTAIAGATSSERSIPSQNTTTPMQDYSDEVTEETVTNRPPIISPTGPPLEYQTPLSTDISSTQNEPSSSTSLFTTKIFIKIPKLATALSTLMSSVPTQTTRLKWTDVSQVPLQKDHLATRVNEVAEEENVTTRETVPIRDGFKTMCEPNNITVFVDKAIIEKYEREYGPLHFNKDDGQNCEGVEYEGHYRYTVAPNILGCGTQFMVNDTHVDFTNTVSNRRQHDESYKSMLDDTGYILIGGAHMKSVPLIHMNIQCTFPIEMTVRTDLIPNLRADVLTFNVSGVGQFSAIMQLFRDDEYRNPYFASPSIAMDDRLRVGVTLLHNKDEDISIAVRKCWATRMRAMDFGTNYSLINDYCPLERTLNGGLVILENGQSKRARWEGPVFKFTLFDEVWLHCELKVCFGDSCQKDCNSSGRSRKRRSVIDIETFGAVVSAGPIFRKTKQDENTDAHGEVSPESGNSDDQKQTEATVIVIFSVLCGVILLSCILFVSLFSKRRRSRRAKETESMTRPESIAPSTLGNRGRNMWESGRYEVTASPVRISQMEAGTLSVLNAHEIEHFADCSEIVVEENCHTDRNFY